MGAETSSPRSLSPGLDPEPPGASPECRSQLDRNRLPLDRMATVDLERIEVLELLGMVLAHLNLAEEQREMSARVPLLVSIRDKLAESLQEEP